MGRAVVHGTLWMAVSTAATKFVSFVAQIALGWLLSEGDFGIYALTLAISSLATILRDGGVRQLLIQRGAAEFEILAGPVFWMALAFNAATGVLIAALAPLAAAVYAEPSLTPMLLVVAASILLSSPGAIIQARLSIDLHFRAIGIIGTGGAVVRYGGSIALAFAGIGPMSFVLPMLGVALFEWWASYIASPTRLFSRAPEPRRWPGLFTQTKWVLLGTLAVCLLNTGAYLALGFMVSKEVVGQYFFAYALVGQVGVLISANLVRVLQPALSRLTADPKRELSAAIRTLRVVMLVGSAISIAMAPTFPAIEQFIWAGKWAASAEAVQWLAVCYPMTVLMSVPYAVQLARGWFRAWGLMMMAIGAGTVAAAAGGALAGSGAAGTGSAASVAAWTGIFTWVAGLAYALGVLSRLGMSLGNVLRNALPAWAIATGAAVTTGVLDHLAPWAEGRAALALRIAITAAAYGFTTGAGYRLLLAPHLQEALNLAPARIRSLVSRLLFLRAP